MTTVQTLLRYRVKSSVEKLTPKIGRLFRLTYPIGFFDFKPGDIFLLVDVQEQELAMAYPDPEKGQGPEAMWARMYAHYSDAVLCYMLCGDREYKHACPGASYFFGYFEQIQGV